MRKMLLRFHYNWNKCVQVSDWHKQREANWIKEETNLLKPRLTSLTQSSHGKVLSNCGGNVDGKYSISKTTSSLVPVAAQ